MNEIEMMKEIIKNTSDQGSLFISFNEHKNVYENVKDLEFVKSNNFISQDDYNLCCETNNIWLVQWYNRTPVGFYKTCGSTLDIALQQMMDVINNDEDNVDEN